MKKTAMTGPDLPNIPWEERPRGATDVVWRYSKNPIIPRDLLPSSNSIFNSAVVPYQGEFRGVFRCDDKRRAMQLHAGRSQDGLRWRLDPERIRFQPAEGFEPTEWGYGYDPRVVWIEDRYYITWCNALAGWPTIGVAYTHDFETFYQMENAFLPFNRNGVLFPRRVNGNYAMLSRPSDRGHTPFGEIYYSESPDMTYWGKHRLVMRPAGGWQSTKIGAGPVPIETSEGWLVFYHGVLTSCNGFVYSMGAALLDIDRPWEVVRRTEPYLLHPRELYERVGDVPNVVFPCAALTDPITGRIAIYYGAADTVTCLSFCRVDEVIDFLEAHSL
ncbi:MAG: glycoside hydrolase family 130 protein [Candidatus Bipolaricaulota bacterium]|nr:glycoside hydrolase family 130 protein [Candidatus Bipolaricaulota bacterium]